MSTKKKNSKSTTLISLFLTVLALFIIYMAIEKRNSLPDEAPDTGDEVIMVIDRTAADVSEITYRIADGETYTFHHNATTGAWAYADEVHYPLNQTTVASMASAICRIGAYRHLEDGDTGVYGFDKPSLTVSVSYADGAVHSYAVGDVNTASGYRYFKDVDTGAVYTIAATLYEYFDYTLDDLFVYDTLPADIEVDYITSVTLADSTGSTEITDADGIASVYEAYTALAPTAYADPYADEEESAAYGIGSLTLTVAYMREVAVSADSGSASTTRIPVTFTISFGNSAEDGRVYYKLSESDVVYLAETEDVDALMKAFTEPA